MTVRDDDPATVARLKLFATGRPVARKHSGADCTRWRPFVGKMPVKFDLLPHPDGFGTGREALNMANAVQEAARVCLDVHMAAAADVKAAF